MTSRKSKIPNGPPVGIDLGTTYSCVAVYQKAGGQETVTIIPNEQGTKTTPSIVAFTEDEGCIVGQAAKDQMTSNPTNTIYDTKRMIGRPFEDDVLQKDKKQWPFKIVEDDGRPKIEVEYNQEMQTFFPEEISCRILIKLKKSAEEFLGKPVTDAVVTVPAYFSEKQREATQQAAQIAGLNVLSIINEPTAAAIAYGFEKHITGARTILVYDLGGGTFDVSLLKIANNEFKVLATAGNNHLGGIDFDNNMVTFCVKDVLQKKNVDISKDKRALCKLREACEKAKRNLTGSAGKSKITVDNLYDGKGYILTFTKGRFNEINDELFESTLIPLKQVLDDANITIADIDDVVLAGGSTKIQHIRMKLEEFFKNKPIAAMDPDEIVAKGAAIRAASFEQQEKCYARLKNFNILDISSLSLGIGDNVGVMHVLIKRNSKLPAEGSSTFTTSRHNQTNVVFPVYEGERSKCKENSMLAEFTLCDIEPQQMGKATIKVTFNLNDDGMLTMTAKDQGPAGKEITITKERGTLHKDDIERLLKEAEQFKEEDALFKANAEAKANLDEYATDASYKAEHNDVPAPDRKKVIEICTEMIDWIEDNKLGDKQKFEDKLKEIKAICDPIIGKF